MAKIKTTDKSGLYAQVSIEADGDIIFMTVAKYKLFMAHGKVGRLAKDVYEHLMFTARLQGTGTVKATEDYVRNALEIGEDSYKAAKKLLVDLGLIENVIRRNEAGKIVGHFVRVKAAVSPAKPQEETAPEAEIRPEAEKSTGWEKPPTGKTPPKCFTEQVEMLYRTSETLEPIGSRPLEAPVPVPVDDDEKSIHRRLRTHFERVYSELHPQHATLYWDAKCGACTKKIITAAKYAANISGEDIDHVIGAKLNLFLNNFREPDDFYAKQTYTPGFFLSQWNRLTPAVAPANTLDHIIRDQELRVAQMSADQEEPEDERNRRELLAILEA